MVAKRRNVQGFSKSGGVSIARLKSALPRKGATAREAGVLSGKSENRNSRTTEPKTIPLAFEGPQGPDLRKSLGVNELPAKHVEALENFSVPDDYPDLNHLMD
ncbi:MAG: hypothetical protein RIB84_11640 [Sneathiellaceae bacterium]